MERAAPGIAAALLAAAALASSGCAAHGVRLAVVEENDVFNLGDGLQVDRDYSQGGVVAATLPSEGTPAWARDAAHSLPLFAREAPVFLGLVLGQEIYTPDDVFTPTPPADDRPFAAWAFLGLALQSPVLDPDPVRRRDRLDHVEADLGVLGPPALGEPAQNAFHRLFDIDRARGWDHQVSGRPGLLLMRESRWRLLSGDFGGSGWRWDLLPRAQARLGNVRTDATAGAMARFGWETPRDFGPMAVDAVGAAAARAPFRPWIYAFGAADARAVGWDVTLQGTVREGPSDVTPTRLVHTATVGLAWGIGPFSATFAQVWVSPEFRERERFHRTTTMMAAWTFSF
jgi:hypothetical protein